MNGTFYDELEYIANEHTLDLKYICLNSTHYYVGLN